MLSYVFEYTRGCVKFRPKSLNILLVLARLRQNKKIFILSPTAYLKEKITIQILKTLSLFSMAASK